MVFCVKINWNMFGTRRVIFTLSCLMLSFFFSGETIFVVKKPVGAIFFFFYYIYAFRGPPQRWSCLDQWPPSNLSTYQHTHTPFILFHQPPACPVLYSNHKNNYNHKRKRNSWFSAKSKDLRHLCKWKKKKKVFIKSKCVISNFFHSFYYHPVVVPFFFYFHFNLSLKRINRRKLIQ